MKTLLALGAGGVSLSYWTRFRGDDWEVAATGGGGVPDPDTPSLEMFTALSCLVTLRDTLDAATAGRMYKVFMDEPWGPDHILRLHKKITAALERGIDRKNHPPATDDVWKLDESEKWFAEHLLTTWYLGVYYHEERPTQRVAFETALMFDPLRGIVPIPFFEATGFGGWTDPPEPVK